MDRKRAKELLPIITAFAEGKTVQWRPIGHGEKVWGALGSHWTFNEVTSDDKVAEYRIKPEPREFWVNTDYTPEFEQNPPWIIAKTSELPIDARTWIKVREVLDDE